MTDTHYWTRTIALNRAALLRIVAVLFLMAGLDEGGADRLPRRVWRRVLRLLCPAESAARRLIVIAASSLEVAPPKPRPEKAPPPGAELQARGLLVIHEGVNLGLAHMWGPEPAAPEKPARGLPAFPLADPVRRFDTRGWDGLRPFPQDGFELADGDQEVKAAGICRRIQALKRALDDIDGHARRLARREARLRLASIQMQGASAPASGQRLAAYDKEKAQLKGTNKRKTLRLGHPPGHRSVPTDTIDDILGECHALALQVQRRDSS